jgi:hypothetical protein
VEFERIGLARWVSQEDARADVARMAVRFGRRPMVTPGTYMTRRITAVPLLNQRKFARNSSDGSGAASEAMVVRSSAEKRAVGRRILIALSDLVGPRATGVEVTVTHPTVKRELLSCDK